MRKSGYLMCIPLLLAGLSAEAGVYRCSGEFGEPYFRQQPCGEDSAVVHRISSVEDEPQGLRPAERTWLEQRSRQRDRSRETQQRQRESAAARQKKARTQAHRCRGKQRSLDEVRAKLRRGYKPASGERLRQRRRVYEDYLATFCS